MRAPAVRSSFGAVAHELLNPLASLRGCVETLAGREQPSEVRAALLDILRRQSQRLEWLIRAVAIDPRTLAGSQADFEGRAALQAAAATAGVDLDAAELRSLPAYGDEELFRRGIEALLFALTHGGATATVDPSTHGVRIASGVHDTGHEAIRWKIDLARALLTHAGMRLRVTTTPSGTIAFVHLQSSRSAA